MQNRQNLPPVNPQFPGFATFATDLRYSRSASKSPIWAWAAVRGGRYTNPISEKSIFPVQFAAGVFTGKIKQTLGGRREATAFCGSRPGRKPTRRLRIGDASLGRKRKTRPYWAAERSAVWAGFAGFTPAVLKDACAGVTVCQKTLRAREGQSPFALQSSPEAV